MHILCTQYTSRVCCGLTNVMHYSFYDPLLFVAIGCISELINSVYYLYFTRHKSIVNDNDRSTTTCDMNSGDTSAVLFIYIRTAEKQKNK